MFIKSLSKVYITIIQVIIFVNDATSLFLWASFNHITFPVLLLKIAQLFAVIIGISYSFYINISNYKYFINTFIKYNFLNSNQIFLSEL